MNHHTLDSILFWLVVCFGTLGAMKAWEAIDRARDVIAVARQLVADERR